MAAAITNKTVQVHHHCVCGHNQVSQQQYRIANKDFKTVGIKRKKCKTTGEKFLSLTYHFAECNCNDEN